MRAYRTARCVVRPLATPTDGSSDLSENAPALGRTVNEKALEPFDVIA